MDNHASGKRVLLLFMVLGFVLFLTGVSPAATLTVGPGDYEYIQDAIDAANPGDTINVKTGTYTEDLRISTNGLTLTAVDGPGTAEIVGDEVWDEVIYIDKGLGITIDGFKISPGSGYETEGIYHDGGEVTDPLTITNNTIEGFSSAGFSAYWDDLDGTTFTFTGNTLTNGDYGTYGVNIGGIREATVNISGNEISDYQYAIQVESNNDIVPLEIRIENNTITGTGASDNEGIKMLNFALDTTYIVGNTIQGNLYNGIYINEIGSSGLPPVVYIEKNDVSGAKYGLYIDDLLYEHTYAAEVYIRYNTFHDNENGFTFSSYDGAVGSTVSIVDNNFVGNSAYGMENMDSVTINAQGNWWGDDTGPYHPVSNPTGLGNEVSDYVDYANWRTTAWEEENDESDSSSGCNTGILNPLFLLLLAPLGLLLRKSR
ncbi:MAG: nitrous oxide reductase family maturation protein NosD [Synergistales bacterium]